MAQVLINNESKKIEISFDSEDSIDMVIFEKTRHIVIEISSGTKHTLHVEISKEEKEMFLKWLE